MHESRKRSCRGLSLWLFVRFIKKRCDLLKHINTFSYWVRHVFSIGETYRVSLRTVVSRGPFSTSRSSSSGGPRLSFLSSLTFRSLGPGTWRTFIRVSEKRNHTTHCNYNWIFSQMCIMGVCAEPFFLCCSISFCCWNVITESTCGIIAFFV